MFPDITRDDVFRLETAQLWLRWPRAADAAIVARLAGNRAVAEMTARIPYPYPPGDAERFIIETRASNAGGRGAGLVMTKKDRPHEPIGCIGLRESARGDALLGYWLSPELWGRGLATEAARAVLDAAFTLTEVAGVRASVRVNNPASRRVLEKCGFLLTGQALELLPARGGMHACDQFELKREVWEAAEPWRSAGARSDGPAVPFPQADPSGPA
jgi:RimJ/RimL family protein N-acetyltransferase